jgi:hypothetical protein
MRCITAGIGLEGFCADAFRWDYVSGMPSPTASSTTVSSAHPGRPEINADLHDVSLRVHEEFGDRFDARAIDECVANVAARFADAKVRSFVPLLVRRYVRDELQARLVPA